MKLSICLFLLSAHITAFTQFSYQNTTASITIHGSSNVHDWQVTSADAKILIETELDSGRLSAIHHLEVVIQAASLSGSKGSVMNKKMHEALKTTAYPEITYKLARINSIKFNDNVHEIAASGYLTIAGVSNGIELLVWAKFNSDRSMSFSFSKEIKMTDYSIDPPAALVGLIKTKDAVNISFDFTVR